MHANSRMRTAALFEDALIGGKVKIKRTPRTETLRESGSVVTVRGQQDSVSLERKMALLGMQNGNQV